MSGTQFWRNDQFRHFLAHRRPARITNRALGRDVPFLDATAIANDNDAIERRIENRLTVLLAGGKLVLLFSRERRRRFHQENVKKLVNNSLGFGSGRRIEFRSFAGKGGQAINGDYMQDLPKSANDLVEGVPRFPTMLRLRIRDERFLISARFSFFFEPVA